MAAGRRDRVPLGGTHRRTPAARQDAAHTRTPESLAALADLVDDVDDHDTTAIMCSETVWLRCCHRRLVAGAALLLRGVDVAHLGHDGRTPVHEPSAGARVVNGVLRYDAQDD